MPDVAYVALGSNLGDRHGYLARARVALAGLPGSRILAASSIEETTPIGGADQPAFLNQMVAIETELAPRALLEQLMNIERREGRRRDVHWGSRTLDLDIVRYEGQLCDEPDLHVPHRELAQRDFWQRELAELAELVDAAKHPTPRKEAS